MNSEVDLDHTRSTSPPSQRNSRRKYVLLSVWGTLRQANALMSAHRLAVGRQASGCSFARIVSVQSQCDSETLTRTKLPSAPPRDQVNQSSRSCSLVFPPLCPETQTSVGIKQDNVIHLVSSLLFFFFSSPRGLLCSAGVFLSVELFFCTLKRSQTPWETLRVGSLVTSLTWWWADTVFNLQHLT